MRPRSPPGSCVQTSYIQLVNPGVRKASGMPHLLVRTPSPSPSPHLVATSPHAFARAAGSSALGLTCHRERALFPPSPLWQGAASLHRCAAVFLTLSQKNAIVIFDEAHNVPASARDAATSSISARSVEGILAQAGRVFGAFEDELARCDAENEPAWALEEAQTHLIECNKLLAFLRAVLAWIEGQRPAEGSIKAEAVQLGFDEMVGCVLSKRRCCRESGRRGCDGLLPTGSTPPPAVTFSGRVARIHLFIIRRARAGLSNLGRRLAASISPRSSKWPARWE